MGVAFSYEVPGSHQMYAAIKAAIGPAAPAGLVAQLVLRVEGGLRHIMVWSSQEEWERFRTDRVEPAVAKVLAAAGIPEPHEGPAITRLDLVDIWVPEPVAELRS